MRLRVPADESIRRHGVWKRIKNVDMYGAYRPRMGLEIQTQRFFSFGCCLILNSNNTALLWYVDT
jgi:hypothetical protein